MTKNIMIVGVGGQGTLLASKMLGYVLLKQGYDVKVSEVHGMSQRGGSVVTYVRYGEKVYSPVIDKGEADVIISRFSQATRCQPLTARLSMPEASERSTSLTTYSLIPSLMRRCSLGSP